MARRKEERKGTDQQIEGKAKEETGDLLDDRSTEVEGRTEKNVRKMRREAVQPLDDLGRPAPESSSNTSETTRDVLDEDERVGRGPRGSD